MASDEPRDISTLVVVALLLLALVFAGDWIITYVQSAANPWNLVPWFGVAAAVIIALGLVAYIRPGRRKDSA
jgi:hypothetical protein